MIKFFSASLLVGLLAVGLAGSAAAGSKQDHISVKTGKLTGVVYQVTGETLPAMALRVTKGSELVAAAKTDAEGRYQFDDLKAGEYELTTAGLKVRLAVSEDGKVSTLKLVVPSGYNAGAGALGALGALGAGGLVIGGLTLAAITAAVVEANRDDKDDRNVSP